jgi:hypothetical protein
MLTAEYLRRQAEACMRIARACFDLASAERLRIMATELQSKAAEMERDELAPRLHALASSNGKTDRG